MISGRPTPRVGVGGPVLLSAVAYGLALAAGARLEAEGRGPSAETPVPEGSLPVASTPVPVAVPPAPRREACLPELELHFPTASSGLVPPEVTELRPLLHVVTAQPDRRVIVEGHADRHGAAAHNLKLSHARARRVGEWLVKHGLRQEQLTIRGFGSYQPRHEGEGHEGDNRRVVVRVEGIPTCPAEGANR